MKEARYRAAVDRARAHLGAGDDLDSVLAMLRADGLSEIGCINAVHELLGVNIGRARALVYRSPVFAGRSDENDALPESLVGALNEVNKVAGLVGDPAQQLGDFRAALTLVLRMVATERDPTGRTVLIVPTDSEILDEVRRLRELANLR